MGKINTNNYPNRPVSAYQDDDMFILQDNGGETYTTNVGDIKNLADSRIKLEGVQVNGSDLPITNKKVNVDISGKTDLSVIAYTFNSEMGYFKGAYVTYNGKLYEFIQEHTGAWNPSHVREIRASGQYVRTGNGGYNNGDRATCEGYMTKASGNYSHAEGRETQAVGDCTHAEGRETIANGIYQHVEGKYNIADNESKYIHIIGNGTDDNNRSNAMTLDWEGNLEVSGDVEDGNGEKISDKADKVTNATSGHLAGLDSNGNLTDSGVSPTEDVTVEGNPVTFDSPFEQDAKSVVVSVKPIQDLHGYDHPWVGGAGKNKLPLTVDGIKTINTGVTGASWSGNVCTLKDVTITVLTNTDGNITGFKFNGMVNGNGTFYLNNTLGLASGDYILSGGHTNPKRIYFYNGTSWYDDNGSGKNFTISGTEASQQVGIVLTNGETYNNEIFYPMIRLATESDATFAPYSNICPISGIDEVEIEVSDGESEPTTTTIPLPSTLYDADVDVTEGSADSKWKKVTFNSKTGVYLFQQYDGTNFKHALFRFDVSDMLIEASPNLENIKSNWAEVKYVNDNSVYNMFTCRKRSNQAQILLFTPTDWGEVTLDELGDFLAQNPIEFCYELATPTTLSLTPTDVELLEGTNVVSTNAEKVAVTYGRSLWQDIDELKTDTEGKLDKSNVADVEGANASKPYSVNEFMLRSDGFYKVTQPIASGASITASNTTKTTIGAVLTALLNA